MDMQVLVRNAMTFQFLCHSSVTVISLLVQVDHHFTKKKKKKFIRLRENIKNLATLLRKNMDSCFNVLNLICYANLLSHFSPIQKTYLNEIYQLSN